jgi:hypothetical protein
VIDCYRLAHWYKQSPDVFLAMKMSDVALHVQRTAQLWKIMAQEARDREASSDG